MSLDLARRRLLAAAGAAGAAGALGLVPSGAFAASGRRPSGSRRSAATIIHGGRVLTGLPYLPRQEALAVGRDGRILAVGPASVVRRLAGRDTDFVDARGGTVMAGIIDAHAHCLEAGTRTLNPSLGNESYTVAALQAKLTGFLNASEGQEPDGWLVVEDWNPVGLPAGTETHHRVLDALPTRRPIALKGSDAHNMWVNQRALDLAKITSNTPDPAGGHIVHDSAGAPSGLLKDTAQDIVAAVIPPPDRDKTLAAAAKALHQAAANGITTYMDAATEPGTLGVYADLAASDRLPQRVVPALRLDTDLIRDPKAALAHVDEQRAAHGQVPGLCFGTVKVFLDGVIEHPAQTAALLEPYLDANGKPTDNRGDLYVTATEYGRLAAVLDRAGWQLHAHAIGDRAVRTALDGYETAVRANGRRGNRHTIAHLQLVHPDDYRRFAPLGVVACMQLQWAMRNVWTMDALLPYIGPDRHRLMYPARSLERHGAALSGGSDWPVDPLDSFNQIRTAVDRRGEEGALYPEREGISRSTSLRMHTSGSAHQLRIDHETGVLTPGRAADVIVLDRDVTRVPVEDITGTEVRLTLAGGRRIWDAERPGAQASAASFAAARPVSLATVHGRHAACGCHGRRPVASPLSLGPA
ncbi:amidohydrolase [Streptomyces malaysiensis]|uniref:amidohydrolase n=1 Tax=Streptomyces malaysiensis TaxID=92644 RepID=UPI0032205B58|nr:amidohydrolase [Streptomyces malaysiensis]